MCSGTQIPVVLSTCQKYVMENHFGSFIKLKMSTTYHGNNINFKETQSLIFRRQADVATTLLLSIVQKWRGGAQ